MRRVNKKRKKEKKQTREKGPGKKKREKVLCRRTVPVRSSKMEEYRMGLIGRFPRLSWMTRKPPDSSSLTIFPLFLEETFRKRVASYMAIGKLEEGERTRGRKKNHSQLSGSKREQPPRRWRSWR